MPKRITGSSGPGFRPPKFETCPRWGANKFRISSLDEPRNKRCRQVPLSITGAPDPRSRDVVAPQDTLSLAGGESAHSPHIRQTELLK
jgi:hypothetical protein